MIYKKDIETLNKQTDMELYGALYTLLKFRCLIYGKTSETNEHKTSIKKKKRRLF